MRAGGGGGGGGESEGTGKGEAGWGAGSGEEEAGRRGRAEKEKKQREGGGGDGRWEGVTGESWGAGGGGRGGGWRGGETEEDRAANRSRAFAHSVLESFHGRGLLPHSLELHQNHHPARSLAHAPPAQLFHETTGAIFAFSSLSTAASPPGDNGTPAPPPGCWASPSFTPYHHDLFRDHCRSVAPAAYAKTKL